MNAVVIGSGRGFGAAICHQLRQRGWNVIGVSRTRTPDVEFQLNVFDLSMVISTVAQIKFRHGSIDAVFCVAGHVNPKSSVELRPQDWNEAWRVNVGYVTVVWHELFETLARSDAPVFATIGSHWSVNHGCDALTPYIVTKHALRAYTAELAANHSWLSANHYCVPTMDTPRYRALREAGTRDVFTHAKPADPMVVADTVVHHATDRLVSGTTYMVGASGKFMERPSCRTSS